MSILETPRAKNPQEQAQVLRVKLKEWEKNFAAAHNGRKAGREDIKQHPDIASKYKQYNKLRAAAGTSVRSPSPAKRTSSPAPSDSVRNPSAKRRRVFSSVHPADIDPYDSPRSVHRTPIHHRTCIGPTPQKDGRVLGLFDLLSPAPGGLKTPSNRGSFRVLNANAFATPTMQLHSGEDATATDTQAASGKPSRSPVRTSKRALLDSLLTPSAQRVIDKSTPRSKVGNGEIQFDETPTFLRRGSQKAWVGRPAGKVENYDANEAVSWSPVAVRRRPKLAGRGLSALVKGLRAMEDEKLDEELDLLREMEGGDDTKGQSGETRKPFTIAIEDSQIVDMPLGPDGARASDDDSESLQDEGKGRDGELLKVWKKKGQKRTTRKTNIKPSTARWKPEPEWKATEEDDEVVLDEPALVPETQIAGNAENLPERSEESDGIAYLEENSRREVEEPKAVKAKLKVRGRPLKSQGDAASTKKVSATAHANFRALKIKNKQSKAKRGARFGRGRR